MRVVVIGGTGLLGRESVLALRERGHEVSVFAKDVPSGHEAAVPGLESVPVHEIDVWGMPEEELAARFAGFEAMVYAVGPDDRSAPPRPAAAFFQTWLVEASERVFRAAATAGVRRAVLLGSYFATWERLHPEFGFAARHPYVSARVEQTRRCIAVGERTGMSVSVLEIPYVFGVHPGVVPFWKEILFDRIAAMPVVLYPRGGTSVTTSRHVGQAAASAVDRGTHAAAYPLGDMDMTWRQLLGHVMSALGKRGPIIDVPCRIADLASGRIARDLVPPGHESGLDPAWLMRDVMCRRIFVPWAPSRRLLGYEDGGVIEAITATVRACYP